MVFDGKFGSRAQDASELKNQRHNSQLANRKRKSREEKKLPMVFVAREKATALAQYRFSLFAAAVQPFKDFQSLTDIVATHE